MLVVAPARAASWGVARRAAKLAMSEKVGVALVGTGVIAGAHAAAVQAHAGAEVVSVFDIDRERLHAAAGQWRVDHVASSLEDLVSFEDVDVVIVCTPPGAHAEATIAALTAGKHVLCEKPFAIDVGDAAAMVKAARDSSVFLACASARLRCSPGYQAARAMSESGELGDVYHARYSAWHMRGRPLQSAWFLDRALSGGGSLADFGVYAVDAVLFMLGNPTVVSVLAQTRPIPEHALPAGMSQDVEDHAVVMLQCADGMSAIVETAWVANMTPAESFVVLGTKAGLRFDPLTKIGARALGAAEYDPIRAWREATGIDAGTSAVYRATEEQVFAYPEMASAGHHQVTQQFLRNVAAGVQPQTSGEEALKITKIIDAAYRSVATGASVALADGDGFEDAIA